MKSIIYARCSTDEKRQDVEIQIKPLRHKLDGMGLKYDIVFEYVSGFRETQPELMKIIENIRKGKYKLMIVFNLDRFSRKAPNKINALLDQIVYNYNCRFISYQENIDSDNELIWNVIKPLFTFFANKYSRDLSERIRRGIERKKELKAYNGGRPKKSVDLSQLRALYEIYGSYRKVADKYNEQHTGKDKISYVTVMKLLKE